jgi:Flp pilus assembly pilin Flp
MNRAYLLWLRYGRPQSGQGMAEYALILGLVAVAAVATWKTLGTNITNTISAIANCL